MCALNFSVAENYHIVDLGTGLSGTNSYAHSINSEGKVVGYWDTLTNGYHAFLYDWGTLTNLGSLGGTNGYALSINDAADVTGFCETADSVRAFLYSTGSLTNLAPMGDLHREQ
jgi:probable HAF family extracellular repeat protein